MTTKLTDRQRQMLEILQRAARPPTLRELGDQMGIRSTNGVYDHLRALERKGYIERSHDLTARAPATILRPLPDVPLNAEGTLQQVRAALSIPSAPEEVLRAVRAIVDGVDAPTAPLLPVGSLEGNRERVLEACRRNRHMPSLFAVGQVTRVPLHEVRAAVESLIADGSIERVAGGYYRSTEPYREHRATLAREET